MKNPKSEKGKRREVRRTRTFCSVRVRYSATNIKPYGVAEYRTEIRKKCPLEFSRGAETIGSRLRRFLEEQR